MKRSLVVTEDGSHTIYSEQFAQHYHSTHGAVQESIHVFINCGLRHYIEQQQKIGHTSKQIHVFEVGFGSGLNALLSQLYLNASYTLYYETVELYPLSVENCEHLDFNLPHAQAHEVLQLLHKAPWEIPVTITPTFTLYKLQCNVLQHALKGIDIVYFDAFSPEAQPELWTIDIFEKLYTAMTPGGVLTTYCAKGEVRRKLQTVGFEVERLPGPPGKREILRASKIGV